jgi:hypothetical protein
VNFIYLGDIVLKKMEPSPRQLSLLPQFDDTIDVPVEKRRELEQVLADLLLSAAKADQPRERRNLL